MITILGVRYTDIQPMRPENADFGVTINYERGRSDPVQVFSAMTELLRAFKGMDRLLVGAVAPEAEVSTVIEDIEAASITAWIKNILNKADDDAIKSMDVRKAIGIYLVKAKYTIIKFADNYQTWADGRRREQLRADLTALAEQARVPTLALPQVEIDNLEGPINELQAAKERLGNGESITVRGEDMPDFEINVRNSERIKLSAEPTGEEEVDGGSAEMLLLIRKPDLIGKAKWEFKHGKQSISAAISDEDWMARFHRGEVVLAPGSEMRAAVRLTYQRDDRSSLTGVEYSVTKVIDVVAPTSEERASLFTDV